MTFQQNADRQHAHGKLDLDAVRAALAALHPQAVFEIRALKCQSNGRGKPFTAAGWFEDLDSAVAEVVRVDADYKPEGIYVTLNPVHPDLLARQSPNKLRTYADNLTADGDATGRRWILIDFDARRKAGISSANDEHLDACAKACEAAEWLKDEHGWPEPLRGSSGNGAHLLFAIDLPNDDSARDLVQAVLLGIKSKWDSATVAVDEKVFNASRITKLYGTVARKGADLPERPHRVSCLLPPVNPGMPVPRELLDRVAALKPAAAIADPSSSSGIGHGDGHGNGQGIDLPPMPERIDRAQKYLAKMPPSIEGQNGSKACYRAAVMLTRDFALPEQEALDLMRTEINSRAVPPWSEQELKRKVRDAAIKGKHKIGSAYQGKPKAISEQRMPMPIGSAYYADDLGTWRKKPTRDGELPEMLANFKAKSVGEVAMDDGVELRRSYEIEAVLRGVTRRATVRAGDFASMNWVGEALGIGAIVAPGIGAKDHLRAAIQTLSDPEIPRRMVYTHTGWREIDGKWVYLHGAGAIGATGAVAGIEVALSGSLEKYILPEPPTGDELRKAILASMQILEAAVDDVSVPLYCAIWRSVLGPADFVMHVSGATGRGKSVHTALAQQHFGPGMSWSNLPGSWSSTANALEGTAFSAADALFTVDDFAPGGGQHDVTALHRVADRFVRNTGNGAARGRMNADGSLRPVKPPRCLTVSTGEDVPRGASIRARLLILEHPGVKFKVVSRCQKDADAGRYAQAMAGYLRWLAPRIADLRRNRLNEIKRLRAKASESGQHRRTPGIVADLMHGFDVFIAFAVEVKAITDAGAESLRARAWAALGRAAHAQAAYLADSDPVRRYLDLLGAAIASGDAHVANLGGGAPEETGVGWGWRTWEDPQGKRIGWIEGDDLYLEPDAAYGVAQVLAGRGGETISLSESTLRRRIHERKLLRSTEKRGGEERLVVRKIVEGKRKRVLHLAASMLVGSESDESGKPKNGPENGPGPEPTGPTTGHSYQPAQQVVTSNGAGWAGSPNVGGGMKIGWGIGS